MTATLVQAWTASRRALHQAGVDQPAIDARLLLEAAAGVSRTDIVTDPHRPLTPDHLAALDALVARRARREPISHILGRKGFWKIMLSVTPDVLTPRADSETVIDVAMEVLAEGRAASVLDLGAGSGALLLAILSERAGARGLGVEASLEALAVARENAANLGLDGRAAFFQGDWTAGLGDESFDLVVSNPPYIPTAVIDTLDPEVRDHEPRLALDGGADGLDAYRRLAPETMRVLRPGGAFVFEIGSEQSQAVETLLRDAGAEGVRTVKDLALRDRVVTGRKKTLGISRSSG